MRKVFLSAAALLALVACQQAPKTQQSARGAMPFPVIEAAAQGFNSNTYYSANIQGKVNSNVQAKISGYITAVLVDEGQVVQQGQPIFKLETQALSQAASSAKASVVAAQIEVDRLAPLVEKGIISPIQLQTAKANLARAKAAYSEVSANIAYATVKAPVSGVVGSINYRQGALVTANNTVLTTVSDISEIYAYFSMNEKEYLAFLAETKGKTVADKIKNLPEVSLQLANGNLYAHKGTVKAVTGQIDATTGSIQFRATFPNLEKQLTHGNSGKILIPLEQNGVVIPESAVFEQQGLAFTYKVVNDTVKQTVVEVANRNNNLALISEGIKAGDMVLAQGLARVRTGMVIVPKRVKMDSLVAAIKPIR